MKKILTAICFSVAIIPNLFGQPDIVIGEIVEDIQEDYPDETDYSELYENLWFYYQNPLNINLATEDQLAELVFLNDGQIRSILEYRRKYYGFKTIYELNYVPVIDRQTARRLVYFIYCGDRYAQDSFALKDVVKGSNMLVTKVELTVEKQKGYIPDEGETPYAGNPVKNMVKYQHDNSYGLSYGLTMEKDAGEEWFQGSNKAGYDFYSGYLLLARPGRILRQVVVGDYHLNFGQGLALHTGFGFGKSANSMDFIKSDYGLKAYRSVTEFGFLRGAAATVEKNNISTTFFVSHSSGDGSLQIDSVNEENYITSLLENGLHRTENEIQKKNAMLQTMAGLISSFSFSKLEAGLCLLGGQYSPPLYKDTTLYNMNNLYRKNFMNLSVSFNYVYRNFYIFDETAFDGQKLAGISGVMANLTENFSTGLLFRYYPSGYFAPFSNSFAESGSMENEMGLYWAINYRPSSKWLVSASIDNFKFPSPRFGVDLPSAGNEYLVDIKYFHNYYLNMYARVKYEVKDKNTSGTEGPLKQIDPASRLSLRYHLNYKINYNLGLKMRVEYSGYRMKENLSHGFLSYEELYYLWIPDRLKVSARYMLFNTDDYNARIYAYESDVMYAFSSPSFSGKGAKYYLLLSFKPLDNLTLQCKAGRLQYFDRETTGSSYQETSVPHKTDIRFLAYWRF